MGGLSMDTDNSVVVVIDTSIWIETRLLRSPLGAGLLYEIYRNNLKIYLPEIIEMEIMKNTIKTGIEACERIKKGYELIEILCGERDDYRLPDENQIEAAILKRLQQLKPVIERTPFEFSHAKAALIRVMYGTPPNGPKNQQFKDSCIWETIKELASDNVVYFITEDKAFFNENNYNKGINNILESELDGKKVVIYSKIESFLDKMRQEQPAFDSDRIADLIKEKVEKMLPDSQMKNWVQINSISDKSIKAFLTEEPNSIAMSFRIEFTLTLLDPMSNSHTEGKGVIEGEGTLLVKNCSINNIQLKTISTYNLGGDLLSRSVTICGGSGAVIGRKVVPFRRKHPLNGR